MMSTTNDWRKFDGLTNANLDALIKRGVVQKVRTTSGRTVYYALTDAGRLVANAVRTIVGY